MSAPGIEWDEARGRYVNRALEHVQEVNRLAGLFRVAALAGRASLRLLVDATLAGTPATVEDVVLALTTAVRESAWNGDAESEKVTGEVAALLAEWLTRAVAQ